jgi:predicted NUDIX family NTP pyrophosphohydrolase
MKVLDSSPRHLQRTAHATARPFRFLQDEKVDLLRCEVMKKESAGLLMYRVREGALQVLLVHPGGPFWRNKDVGAWSIPKGEVEAGEDLLVAARREFLEELGMEVEGTCYPLGSIRQKAGKVVHAWAVDGDLDVTKVRSNFVEIEWPPRSGKKVPFPEVDRAEFFSIEEATGKINSAQMMFLERLVDIAKV